VSILHAIVLGIVQGLAEYLPISSSGHLILVPWLLGWNDFAGDESLKKAFDVALHLGTLVGAVAYFRSDISRLARAAIAGPRGRDRRLAWLLVLSAVPAAIGGALLADTIENNTDQVWLVAVMLIVGALALAWADGVLGRRTIDEVSTRDAAVMGVGQALALQPGVSRSGVTMTLGRYMGLGRDPAVRFAFLMSLPITAAALVYKAVDVHAAGASLRTCGRRSCGASPPPLSPATSPCGGCSSWWATGRSHRSSCTAWCSASWCWPSSPPRSADQTPPPGAAAFEHPGRPLRPDHDPTARIVDPVGAQPRILQRAQAQPSFSDPVLAVSTMNASALT
jgi:undecaprenyl-diphosphatase